MVFVGYWLVVWNHGMWIDFPSIGNVISSKLMKSIIFQRGRYTTNQVIYRTSIHGFINQFRALGGTLQCFGPGLCENQTSSVSIDHGLHFDVYGCLAWHGQTGVNFHRTCHRPLGIFKGGQFVTKHQNPATLAILRCRMGPQFVSKKLVQISIMRSGCMIRKYPLVMTTIAIENDHLQLIYLF